MRSLKNARQTNSTTKSPEKDVNVAKKSNKIQDNSRNGTNNKYDVNGHVNKRSTENKSINDGSTNCSDDVSDGSQILSNSAVDFPSLSGKNDSLRIRYLSTAKM